jgi:sigma-B regulation protein RsbU (phosphoserine phosphatase)
MQLGIAIGDVSGKGIPAALLMATLRAYLRSAQTIHHQADLTEVMRNLNKLVYESSPANRYPHSSTASSTWNREC